MEILALIVFIAVGCMYVSGGGGYGEFSTEPFYKPGEVDLHFVATAVSLACLSFLGFDGMSTLAEETYKPEKNIGKGILIALCIMIVVFVAQTYVAALILPDWANTDPDMASSMPATLPAVCCCRTSCWLSTSSPSASPTS